MLNRSKLWAVGFLVAAFTLGIAVGGAVSAAWGDEDERSARADERGNDRRRGRTSYLARLNDELQLTAVQRESVQVILERRQAAMDELSNKMRTEFVALRQDVRIAIMDVLGDDQQHAYQQLLERSDSARAARERGEKRHDRK